MRSILNAGDVARWRLCVGCGACAAVCPERKITLVDALAEGIRPVLTDTDCGTCRDCLRVCPAWDAAPGAPPRREGTIPELWAACGPVLEIWEGHATDDAIRHRGASGGVLSALALFALEREAVAGVLHVTADPEAPLRNRTTFSRARGELLAGSGSRYAPASVADGLAVIEQATGPCVFIGQPSEVTALRRAQEIRPGLARNVALALSFFCAGTPARAGTEEVLAELGLRPEEVAGVRYRGCGWPGRFTAHPARADRAERSMSYAESWSILQAYRPFATHLSPDGTGEDADISCGDAWYRPARGDEPGSSLLLVRTEAGRRFLQAARAAGYVALEAGRPSMLLDSQAYLLAKRGAVRGRVAALRLLGLPAPRRARFDLAASWRALPLAARARAFFGTLRRALTRGYLRPAPPPAGPPVRPCLILPPATP